MNVDNILTERVIARIIEATLSEYSYQASDECIAAIAHRVVTFVGGN